MATNSITSEYAPKFDTMRGEMNSSAENILTAEVSDVSKIFCVTLNT